MGRPVAQGRPSSGGSSQFPMIPGKPTDGNLHSVLKFKFPETTMLPALPLAMTFCSFESNGLKRTVVHMKKMPGSVKDPFLNATKCPASGKSNHVISLAQRQECTDIFGKRAT